ncbi:MAG TPA: methionine--tRNA ligase, partial [Deinococcales bacterium]|nr:methionine--tRNA ligase [Deinococcales bacterium]
MDTEKQQRGTPPGQGTYYATTPIFYVNAEPHLGHAYTTTLVDVATRYHRLRGEDVLFLTGTDEHGEKIQKAAEEAGMSPAAYVDRISGKFQAAWDELGISYDVFMRTTAPEHHRVVQEVLQRVYDNGDIIFGEYGGLYCVQCERYYTEKELEDGKCPQHDIVLEYRSEENYFFRMERYRPWLRRELEENPDLIRPEGYRNEVLGMLREPIGDLSISRPRDRVPWGIPLPWDENHVTYVWFDALINYWTALVERGEEDRYWPHVEHFIAKDILKPHGVFWPTMLKSAGLPLYAHLNVHGYWLTDQGKMSKSKGNVIRPLDLKDKYGIDAFRYFLLRDMTFGLDSTFSELGLAERINSDLANDLGNLLNRTLGMLGRYRDGRVPAYGDVADEDLALRRTFEALPEKISGLIDRVQFDRVIATVLDAVGKANKYVSDTRPWELARSEENSARLDTVLRNCVQALRTAGILLDPVIPGKARELRLQLGLPDSDLSLAAAGDWDALPDGF